MQSDWKTQIERNVQEWLAESENQTRFVPAEDEPDAPDLYFFFETLSVLQHDVHKEARRSREAFSRFGEVLSAFEQSLGALSSRLSDSREMSIEPGALEKKMYKPLVMLLDRFKRLQSRLKTLPGPTFFPGGRKWLKSWKSLAEGFDIIHDHLESMLRKEGIVRLAAEGNPFDPSWMVALELQPSEVYEAGTVIEEVSGGYLYNGNVLKYAEVIISKKEK